MTQAVATGRRGLVTRHDSSSFVRVYYEEIRSLGEGTFGRVALVRERLTGQHRVAKIVDISQMEPNVLEMARTEIRLLRDLDHPCVVRIYEYAEDFARKELVLILEYLSGGDCLRLLNDPMGLPSEALVARIISQALLALSHLHARGVVHRDVKLENLMLGATSQADCRLIDFGLSACCDKPLLEVLGTPSYMAPEVAGQTGYTSKADIWSLGVCAAELLTGTNPIGRPADFGDHIGLIKRLARYQTFSEATARLEATAGWSLCSPEARDFVRRIMTANSSSRPSAAKALQHPWLQMHAQEEPGLTPELLESLTGFAGAAPVIQSCCYAIAARTDFADFKQLGNVFLGADLDGDGRISRAELSSAVEEARAWWSPEVNVEELFEAMDVDGHGSLSFTKFAAGCLHGIYSSHEDVLTAAFEVLDGDRDGLITVQEVRRLLPSCDSPILHRLPLGRGFGVDDWIACLVPGCRRTAKAAKAAKPQPKSNGSFFDRFLCTGCRLHDVEDGERVQLQTNRFVMPPYAPVACY